MSLSEVQLSHIKQHMHHVTFVTTLRQVSDIRAVVILFWPADLPPFSASVETFKQVIVLCGANLTWCNKGILLSST